VIGERKTCCAREGAATIDGARVTETGAIRTACMPRSWLHARSSSARKIGLAATGAAGSILSAAETDVMVARHVATVAIETIAVQQIADNLHTEASSSVLTLHLLRTWLPRYTPMRVRPTTRTPHTLVSRLVRLRSPRI
jgi:hypothetical protein